MSRPLTRTELVGWARLARTPRVGAATFTRIWTQHRAPDAAFAAFSRMAPEAAAGAPSKAEIEDEIGRLEALGGRLVARMEPDYPAALAALANPPPILSMLGAHGLGRRPAVAIVGAREASAAGRLMAETLARDLGAAGFVIASGLARGIDAAAHRASLATGTIAVLAGGLDKPYPPENMELFEQIAEVGLAVSEARLGLAPRAQDFPRRNLIIAGLAQAVVVVEAEVRSGSLITARAALDFGREALAVPGSPLDPRARGSNGLIKDGAALVEGAEDVLAALGAPRRLDADAASAPWTEETTSASAGLGETVLKLLSPTPVHLNELARAAGAAPSAVAAALVELELRGAAFSIAGGYASSGR